VTGRHARAFGPSRCNVTNDRLELAHQGVVVGSIVVSEDHENRIVAAAGLQTAAHIEEIASAVVFRPSQDPRNDGIGRDDKRAPTGIVIYKIEYCIMLAETNKNTIAAKSKQ